MKKFLKISVGLFIVLFLIGFILVLALPYLVNLDLIKSKIEKETSRRIKAQVSTQDLIIKIFPRPALQLRNLQIKNASICFFSQNIDLSLELRPLFHKRLEIKHLFLEKPFLYINWPVHKGTKSKKKELWSWGRSLIEKIPLITMESHKGEVKIVSQGKTWIHLKDVNLKTDVFQEQILIEGSSSSPAWEKINFNLKIWPQITILEGLLRIKNLDLAQQPLLYKLLKLKDIESNISLDLNFRLENDHWYLGYKITSPSHIKIQNLDFSFIKLLGKISFKTKESIKISIKQILMDEPKIKGSGEFLWLPKKARIKIDLDSLDFTAWRKRFLPWGKKNKGLYYFFKVLRKAQMEKVHLESTASSIKGLWNLSSLKIKGLACQAEVQVPILTSPLMVQKAECTLENNILRIKEGKGAYKGGFFSKTLLSLFLFDLKKPFRLETDLDVEAQDALKEIKRLVRKIHPLYEELEKIQQIQGPVSGHLLIEGSLKKPQVSFSIHPRGVFILYKRWPLPLRIHKGSISYKNLEVIGQGLEISFPKSYIESLSGRLSFKKKNPFLDLKEFRGKISVSELHDIEKTLPLFKKSKIHDILISGKIFVTKALFKAPLSEAAFKNKLLLEAKVQNLLLAIPPLPDKLKVFKGTFRYRGGKISFSPSDVQLLDSSGLISGEIDSIWGKNPKIALKGETLLKPRLTDWISEISHLPPQFYPLLPLKCPDFDLTINGKDINLAATFISSKGIKVELNLSKKGSVLRFPKLRLLAKEREFFLVLNLYPQKITFFARGLLFKKDWEKFFARSLLDVELLKIEGKGKYFPSSITQSSFQGWIYAKNLKFSWKGLPLIFQEFQGKGTGKKFSISKFKVAGPGFYLTGQGKIELTLKNILLSGNVFSPKIDLDKILSHKKSYALKAKKFPLLAKIDIKTDKLRIKKKTIEKIYGTLFYSQKDFKWVIEQAKVCNINLIGEISSSLPDSSPKIRISFYKKNGDLERLVDCFFKKEHLFSGKYNLTGSFNSLWQKSIWNKTEGKIFLISHKGKIYKFGPMVNIWAYLSPYDIFKGNLPNLSQEGFSYELLEVKGFFRGPYFIVDEVQIRGPGLRIFASGKINLVQQKLYLTALISPFIAADAVVSHLPVIGWVLTGKSKTFFSFPVEIRGKINNPKIIPLDPRAVSKKVVGIIERTFQLPVKIFIPQEKSLKVNEKEHLFGK